MSKQWPKVRLGEVLRRSEETIELQPDAEYRQITVKLWGKGVVLRGILTGAEIAASRQMVARRGQFILSRIDARNGALGIVPDELDGAIVTNDFPLFRVAETSLLPLFLSWMSRTSGFVEMCQTASEGTTNRVRLQEDKFLVREIPLPPLAEQRRIVARIEELAAQIEEAKALRKQAAEEAEALVKSRIKQIIEKKIASKSWKLASLPEFVSTSHHAIKRGPFGSHLRKEFFVLSGYKVYEQKHAIYGDFSIGSYYINGKKFHEMHSFEIKPGDLIISCSGTIGKVAIVPDSAEPGIINQALLKITLDPSKIDRRFFKLVFESAFIKEEIIAISPGSAMKNIGSVKILKTIKFPLPLLHEQQLIVAGLDALQTEVDKLKRLQAETAVELDALLPSILDKAFKGEL